MKKYRVTIKYGKPGEYKSNSQQVTVDAESDSSAMQLAVNKFKSSNLSYRNMDAEAVAVKQI